MQFHFSPFIQLLNHYQMLLQNFNTGTLQLAEIVKNLQLLLREQLQVEQSVASIETKGVIKINDIIGDNVNNDTVHIH
jgi:hypothetical protein